MGPKSPTIIGVMFIAGSISLGNLLQAGEIGQAKRPNKNPGCKPPLGADEREGFSSDRVRAVVNGKPILDHEIRAECFRELGISGRLDKLIHKDICNQVLERLIEQEVILSTVANNLKGRPQAEARLRQLAANEGKKQVLEIRRKLNRVQTLEDLLGAQGLTLPLLCQQIEHHFVAEEYIRCQMVGAPSFISSRAVNQYYKEHPDEFDENGYQKPLDEDTQKQITTKLKAVEYQRIVNELKRTSAIQKLAVHND